MAMRPAFAGHAYAWTWRELVINRVVLKKVGEWLTSNTIQGNCKMA